MLLNEQLALNCTDLGLVWEKFAMKRAAEASIGAAYEYAVP